MPNATNLKQVTCAPDCGFNLRSHDETELVYFVMSHSKNAHNKAMSERDVRAIVRPA